MTPVSSKIDAGVVAFAAAGLVLAGVLVAPRVLEIGDLYWHIAAGRWMIENQAVLRIDPFSATFAGHPWLAQSWLADVAVALAYVGVGWSGVLAATATAAALSAALLGYFLARRLNALVLLATLALAFAVGAEALRANSTILALPLLVVWCAGLAKAREQQRIPSFALLPAMLLWANIDASYLSGLALAAIMACEAIIDSPGKRLVVARDWAIFAGLAVVFSLITPYGIEGMSAGIREVQLPQSGDIRTALPLILAMPAVALVVQSRAFPFRVVFLGALFVFSLTIRANELLFAAATPLLLADLAASSLQQNGFSPRIAWKPGLAFALLALMALGARLVIPTERGDETISPRSALAKLPTRLLHAAVLNDRAFGGYLIFRDVHPYIDNRPLYSRAFRERYARITSGDSTMLAATLDRRHIKWTLFPPGSAAAGEMDSMDKWQRLYADQWAVVHVRKGAL